jgi:hypothetical protein
MRKFYFLLSFLGVSGRLGFLEFQIFNDLLLTRARRTIEEILHIIDFPLVIRLHKFFLSEKNNINVGS